MRIWMKYFIVVEIILLLIVVVLASLAIVTVLKALVIFVLSTSIARFFLEGWFVDKQFYIDNPQYKRD